MSGILVLALVLVLLTTRTRRGRRRWARLLSDLWLLLAWCATLALPRSPAARRKPLRTSLRPPAAPHAPRPARKRRSPWPAPPRRPRRYAPGDERPGQGPRYFTHAQKQLLLQQAGYRCQRMTLLGRCHRTDQLRADHRHPYSWGGRTIVENGWILCDPHNVEKGAHFTDVKDPAELERVCVPWMLPRNRFRRKVRA